MTDMERDVGRLEARMESVEQELQAMRSDVREIRDAVVAAKSGWLVLATVASIAASAGAVMSTYLPLLWRNNS
jgi:chromosome condensin MukBEF ATPase and DNA-binding subunit MukB